MGNIILFGLKGCGIFSDACMHCDTAGIPELYTNAFMGHRNHMGQEYSELSKAKLELEYLRVEPFLTVYGQTEEGLEIKDDVRKMKVRIVDLNKDIVEQKNTIEKLRKENISSKKVAETMTKRVSELETKLREAINQNDELKPLSDFVNSFKTQEDLQTFLNLFRGSSVIKFPEQKMRLVLDVPFKTGDTFKKLEDKKRVIITEIFQEVWDKLSQETLDLILKQLKERNTS